jgi:prolyl 4-hydroxylase
MTGTTGTAAGGSLAARADALVAAGLVGDACRLLTGPAAAIDADALCMLANWRLAGQFVRRDLAASRDLFRRSGEAGSAQAAAIFRAFVANGTGGPPDWALALRLLEQAAPHDPAARTQLALIGKMRLSPCGDPLEMPPEERLSERPQIFCFRRLFSPAECDFLIAEARPWLGPSVVIDPRTGRHFQNPIRTSDGMAFPFVQENPAVHALNRRIAAATGTDAAQGEPLQVLRYRPGQEYRPHSDAVAGEANQRILTVLVYLTEDYSGGETRFMRTGLTFKGCRGDALVFRNALSDGRPDELAQHAGLPVAGGEKIIASRWIRARPFTLPPPTPLLNV